MIEIVNPIPVFDEGHNVVSFNYNDGLIIHDCLTNTLNVSYLIVKDLMSDSKKIEEVLSELKEHFSLFSDVKCHERDFLINTINGLVIKVDLETWPDNIFWFTNDGEFMMEYSKSKNIFWLSEKKIWLGFKPIYCYSDYELTYVYELILSEYFNMDYVNAMCGSSEVGENISKYFKMIPAQENYKIH